MQDVNHQLFTESVIEEVLLSMDVSDVNGEAARQKARQKAMGISKNSGKIFRDSLQQNRCGTPTAIRLHIF